MKTRVATAFVAAVPVLAAVAYAGRWPLLLIAAAASLVATYELSALARIADRRVSFFALLVGAVLAASVVYPNTRFPLAAALCAGVTVLGVLAAARLRSHGGSILVFEAATLWIVGPLVALASLHAARATEAVWQPANVVLLALVPIWVGDSAAMLVGKAWGKRLLAPALSPKKTVEGALANLVGCVAAALLLGPWLEVAWPFALGAGLACGVLGQAGDLFQSSLKRAADLKDSGSILPGHGGLLDRIDSLLFAAPAVAAILAVPGALHP
ncbi:MAG: phosphatidate cytidylyltransferase [Fimbriimonadaceae bacterium]|nr:phosphatidate cytidylyltransferase [Chthonomonadaceae bacterium]MCO5296113.1 phosphatidate cytidylyltransferase [Fimbriimonadaceae bacterium]